jgi:hypothetical protein
MKFYNITVFRNIKKKKKAIAGCWWLMPVILATWGAEIRRIIV